MSISVRILADVLRPDGKASAHKGDVGCADKADMAKDIVPVKLYGNVNRSRIPRASVAQILFAVWDTNTHSYMDDGNGSIVVFSDVVEALHSIADGSGGSVAGLMVAEYLEGPWGPPSYATQDTCTEVVHACVQARQTNKPTFTL